MTARTFGINAMLSDMEPLLRRVAGSHLDLAYQQSAGLWPVSITPGKLEEVLLALAIDACEAMGEHGVLRLQTANLPAVDGLPAGEYVRLSVSDTARSVSAALSAAVRGSGRREGLGVRLGIEISEAAGGRLDLAPNTGGGLTVHLVLPRAPGVAPELPVTDAAPRAATETILVVEDDTVMMGATSRVLTRMGYSVLMAVSAEAAIRQLEQHTGPLDLVLTDIGLPGMDGLRLAKEVRKRRPGMKLIFMSGYSEETLRLKDVAEPDAPLLEKPFTMEKLAATLRSVLDGPAKQ